MQFFRIKTITNKDEIERSFFSPFHFPLNKATELLNFAVKEKGFKKSNYEIVEYDEEVDNSIEWKEEYNKLKIQDIEIMVRGIFSD